MNILSRILGTDKALNSVISGVSKGLDKLAYTKQEKAEHALKDRAEARAMVVKWMESTQGQNLARRVIALAITSIWILQYIISMLLHLIAVWVDNYKLQESADVIGSYAENMNGAMMLILAFYFAAPHMGQIVTGALNKFGQTNKKI